MQFTHLAAVILLLEQQIEELLSAATTGGWVSSWEVTVTCDILIVLYIHPWCVFSCNSALLIIKIHICQQRPKYNSNICGANRLP